MSKIFFTKSSQETKKLAREIAKTIKATPQKKTALIFALEGELGAGKTTFLQGFARGLGIKEKILSPTFILMRKFKIKNSGFENFYHIDCYRIKKAKEILNLGFKEIIKNPKNIVAIEWADKIEKIFPRGTIKVKFEISNRKRKITIIGKTAKIAFQNQ